MNDSPENTAARMLERVTGPFHFVVLAGVLNDPAEQARAPTRLAFILKLCNATACERNGLASSLNARLEDFNPRPPSPEPESRKF